MWRRRLQIVSQNFPPEVVDAAVKVGITRVRVALNHVAEDVETFGREDVGYLSSRILDKSGINSCRDSSFHIFYFLKAKSTFDDDE